MTLMVWTGTTGTQLDLVIKLEVFSFHLRFVSPADLNCPVLQQKQIPDRSLANYRSNFSQVEFMNSLLILIAIKHARAVLISFYKRNRTSRFTRILY